MESTTKEQGFNLNDTLNRVFEIESVDHIEDEEIGNNNNNTVQDIDPRLCVECEELNAVLYCKQCQDKFCQICFQTQHRRGKREKHETSKYPLEQEQIQQETDKNLEMDTSPEEGEQDTNQQEEVDTSKSFVERAKYIPVRLSLKERKFLRLLRAAIKVNDYTDKVDQSTLTKSKRTYAQILEICSVLSGIAICVDYKMGQELVINRNLKENSTFYQNVFELGRRHKVLNPEKMRSQYGKILYYLQDSMSPQIKNLLEFACKGEMVTVYRFLQERGAEKMLEDELVEVATRAISEWDGPGSQKKDRYQIRQEVKDKEYAVKKLAKRYSNSKIDEEEIKWCLYSIGDNNSFLLFNTKPIEYMIFFLKKFFSPNNVEEGYSLEIYGGEGGSRLTHSHDRQFNYALQSLTLWRDISNDMFKLWCLADDDMLSSQNKYNLNDTGQGYHRIQNCPLVSKAMRNVLYNAQQKVKDWIGSSVIHLGDNNVPNALMFIDKYTQVSKILNPIVIVVQRIDELVKDEGLSFYIENTFGGPEKLKKDILMDFFKSAFDGSGGENFFESGSCIDGRLTSAWNWCSKLSEKFYYPIFKLTGFLGFN
eukprot:TRINITY_DN6814_c0_g1_i1.p1 TRINITY_DN6814_c0_g1~~TRINITY_DN6814_c0_g1_i1.p1  ORF type:complete len:608 (-),score=198.84 TRINITY_DN6814_c0_g1_i1:66-1844(-)